MSRKRIIGLGIGLVLLVSALALGKGWRMYYDRKRPNFTGPVEVFVRPGTPVDSVLQDLLRSGGVRNPASLRRALSTVDTVCPGHYTLTARDPSLYAARMLSHGWQSPVNLVLSGTMRLQSGIARKISNQMLLDSVDVIVALRDSALLAGYGYTPQTVFALFMPDTYQVYWTDGMKEILDKQKAAQDAFWTEENRACARRQGLTPLEVSIVASIVSGETNHEPEMPAIAGVYLNRLHKGMKLQADPTVAYCFDYTLNRILYKHLAVDSPFNTYLHEGLPPAPICVPGKAALEAVLHPDPHGYLFFCASPRLDGTHRFAVTLAEHSRNAQAFQRALNARGNK